MKAIVIRGPGKAEVVNDQPEPKIRPTYIKVKVVAVALNPTDWKHIDFLATPGAVVGCDLSGIVEEVGPEVSSPWKKGDEVFGFVHGSNAVDLEAGSFAEFALCKDGILARKPTTLSFEEAATFGVGITTVAQSLFEALGASLTAPAKTPTPVLIYGGSTATGTLAIQLAKLAGLEPIVTCSPKNNALCTSLGASACFDYNDIACAELIQRHTQNKLTLALDTISNDQTAAICAAAISTDASLQPKKYTALGLRKSFPREDVKFGYTMAYTALGEAYKMMGNEVPADPKEYEFQKQFWQQAEKLVAEGKLKPHPVEVKTGGLAGVLEGLQLLRENKVSGTKLVYRISETA